MHIPEIIQGFVCIGATGAVMLAYSMRTLDKTRFFLPLTSAVFLWAFGYLLELGAGSLDGAYLAQRTQYLGITICPVYYYLFVRDFGTRPLHSYRRISWLLISSFCMGIFAWLWPMSELLYKDLTFTTGTPGHLVIDRGPLYNVHIIYTAILLFLSIYEAIRFYPQKTKEDIHKRRIFIFTSLLPLISVGIFYMDSIALPMGIGPALMVITLLIQGIDQLKCRPKEWLPFARDIIIEQMADPYVILDTEGGLLDANERAKVFFPYLRDLNPGAFTTGMDILPHGVFDGITWKELSAQLDGQTYWFRAQTTPIFHKGKAVCLSVMLCDITEQRHALDTFRELATHDTLTGLIERGTFMTWVSRDFELVLRKELPASVIMIDIDYFKHVNDTYGHLTGDDVLRWLAQLLRKRLRKTDLCTRYGGEEFLLFMPVTVAEDAETIANDLLAEVRNHSFQAKQGRFKITVCMGIAQAEIGVHQTIEDLIGNADKALYYGKNRGRDQCNIYHAGMAQEKIS